MRIQSLRCKIAEGVLVKTRETGPTFLRIRWEVVSEDDGRLVIKEATLCKPHREEIALKFPNSWGCGQASLHCEFCEGRRPGRTLPGHHQHSTCDQRATFSAFSPRSSSAISTAWRESQLVLGPTWFRAGGLSS